MAHNLNVTGSLSGSVSSSSVISGGTTSPDMSVTGTTITVTPGTTNTYITVPNTATPYTPGPFTFTPSSPGPIFTMPTATISESEIVAIRFDTSHGPIKICRDGRIEIPDSLSEDEGLAELWKNLEGMARRAILEEVRRAAAKAIEKVLPDLLPDMHEYNKKLLPIAAAMAISIDDV